MKSFALVPLLALMAGAPLSAASPEKIPTPPMTMISPGEVAATPEMWFYQQYQQQYQDPKAMVHQKADAVATDRARRLSSLKWYGMSNSRPRASADPYNGDYSAYWASGDYSYPYRWQAAAPAVIFLPAHADR